MVTWEGDTVSRKVVSRGEASPLAPEGLTPAIPPNVGNSTAQLVVVGDWLSPKEQVNK